MEDFQLFFGIGWDHIISRDALDHILFILALSAIYLMKDWKQVLILVTAFTVGHAVTLVLSSLELITIDSDLVEFLIPCTIVVTAVANLFQKTFTPKAIRINYFLALFFGLIHGLAFANLIRFMLVEDQNFVVSMLSFSIGLELGQILVVLLILLLAFVFVQRLHLNRRLWVALLSVPVAIFSLKMAIERWPW